MTGCVGIAALPSDPDDIIRMTLVRLCWTKGVKIIQWAFKRAKSKCRGARGFHNHVCLLSEAPLSVSLSVCVAAVADQFWEQLYRNDRNVCAFVCVRARFHPTTIKSVICHVHSIIQLVLEVDLHGRSRIMVNWWLSLCHCHALFFSVKLLSFISFYFV